MIKNLNKQELDDMGVQTKYHLLFQAWKELTDPRTMDSYQYRMMNSLSALYELNDVIEQKLKHYVNTNHNIDECKEETAELLANDCVIKEHFPSIARTIQRHLHEKTETDAQLRALQYQINYCYNILSIDYTRLLVEALEKDLDESNESGIIQKANMIVSNCAWNGWSTRALSSLIDLLKDSITNAEKWITFRQKILSTQQDNYIVFVPMVLKYKPIGIDKREMIARTHREISDLGIPVHTKEEILEMYSLLDNTDISCDRYFKIQVTAFDYYAACYNAIDKCADALNMLSFYNYIEAWNTQNMVFVAYNTQTQSKKQIRDQQLFFTYEYLDSSQKVYRASKRLFMLSDTTINKKLQATYAYVNIGRGSRSQEEQFMNLWVALESLCRSSVYENIISNVLETVPSALCSRYMYQHFRNFYEDCRRCGIDLTFSSRSITADEMNRQLVVKEILEIMRDEGLYEELKDKCQINELLAHRCKTLHKVANEDSEFVRKIISHYSNVKKQLSRLYRLRNNIAHNASTANGALRLYIEHLSDYLSCFVSEVVMRAEKKNEDNAEIVFEMIKDNYRMFNEYASMKKGKGFEMLSDLFATGIISLL